MKKQTNIYESKFEIDPVIMAQVMSKKKKKHISFFEQVLPWLIFIGVCLLIVAAVYWLVQLMAAIDIVIKGMRNV